MDFKSKTALVEHIMQLEKEGWIEGEMVVKQDGRKTLGRMMYTISFKNLEK